MKRLLLILFAVLSAAAPVSAAIALDATAADAGAVNSTSTTWNHTTSGSDRILLVAHAINSLSDIGTGCTYNSVAMTLIDKYVDVTENVPYIYLYRLIAPATGSNAIVCSTSGTTIQEGGSISYTGAAQTGQPDSFAHRNSTDAGGQAPSFTLTTTVVAANCWQVSLFRASSNFPVAGTGTTQRVLWTDLAVMMGDSNGTVGTGSQSMTATRAVNDAWNGVTASIAPAGGAPATNKNRTLLGVGQ